jgi:hypothetical protein
MAQNCFFTKPSDRLIKLEYRPDKPLLKVLQYKTSHLDKMGVRRRDGLFLYAEEAVFLTEQGSAVILCNGCPLPLTHVYRILHLRKISPLKYSTFSRLTKAGYSLKPAQSRQVANEELPAKTSLNAAFPGEILDKFPGLTKDGRLLVHDMDTSEALGDPQLSAKIEPADMEKLATSHRSQEGTAKEPWNSCRPKYWPSFAALRNVQDWNSYTTQRDKLLSESRKRPSSSFSQRTANYDYDVFAGVQQQKQLYRITVVDDRFGFEIPSVEELALLASSDCYPLLLATANPSDIRIFQCQLTSESALSLLPIQL